MKTIEITSLEMEGSKAVLFEVVLQGEAIAQNGWKMAFRGKKKPYIFDPISKEKKTMRKQILEAIQACNVAMPIFNETPLKIQVSFSLQEYPAKTWITCQSSCWILLKEQPLTMTNLLSIST